MDVVQWTKLTNLAARGSFGAMTTITTHQAKTHLSRYLAEVEEGREFLIARGKTVVARLVPLATPAPRPRPKVGEIKGKPFKFPAAALAPLTAGELKEWGL
jgi:antitoxin (DNA-binding transcriptional repressor) of toxin-antitoxin stability system